MTPPRSAHYAARLRTVAGVEALTYGLLTYDGDEYECAVSLEAEGYEYTDRGKNKTQRLRANIRKTLLPTKPVDGKMVIYEGRAYEIELVNGDHIEIPDWEVTAFRVPGGDVPPEEEEPEEPQEEDPEDEEGGEPEEGE